MAWVDGWLGFVGLGLSIEHLDTIVCFLGFSYCGSSRGIYLIDWRICLLVMNGLMMVVALYPGIDDDGMVGLIPGYLRLQC